MNDVIFVSTMYMQNADKHQFSTLGSLFALLPSIYQSCCTFYYFSVSHSVSLSLIHIWSILILCHATPYYSFRKSLDGLYETKEVKCNANITKRNETIYDGKLFDGINSFFLNTKCIFGLAVEPFSLCLVCSYTKWFIWLARTHHFPGERHIQCTKLT